MGWVPQAGATVTDASGTHFVLADQIGEGGQGVVFATQAEGAAVKISTARNAAEHRKVLERQIADVARMPLADLPVAAPRYPLTGDVVGYTMTWGSTMSRCRWWATGSSTCGSPPDTRSGSLTRHWRCGVNVPVRPGHRRTVCWLHNDFTSSTT